MPSVVFSELKWTRERTAVFGGTSNDEVAANIAATRRRRIWKVVFVANVVALTAAIAGCLLMMKTQGVRADVAEMRDEIGETLTMMTIDGASKSVARHLPHLIDTAARWDRAFAAKSESFRGLDVEINQVQEMHRLGETAERWRKELEGVSPMQRSEYWQKGLKAQIETEQKKWPNRTHRKGVSEWFGDIGKEFWFGVQHGALWPVGIYERMSELIKGGRALDALGSGDCLRYILFPYRLSSLTMLRLAGIVIVTSCLGYLLCWLGLKTRFGGLSYVGLLYFLYLLNITFFIVWLEIME